MNGDIWYIDTSTYIANLDVANITYQLPVNIDNMKNVTRKVAIESFDCCDYKLFWSL